MLFSVDGPGNLLHGAAQWGASISEDGSVHLSRGGSLVNSLPGVGIGCGLTQSSGLNSSHVLGHCSGIAILRVDALVVLWLPDSGNWFRGHHLV